MSDMMVTDKIKKNHNTCFGAILMIFIFHLKIYITVCEPHFVKLYVFNLIHSEGVLLF